MKRPLSQYAKSHHVWTWLIAGVGVLWSARSAIDPRYAAHGLWGPFLVGGALLLAWRLGKRWDVFVLPCVLAVVFVVSAHIPVQFRADSALYYSYLRSMAFDGDIDYSNEWETWGYGATVLTQTGLPLFRTMPSA